MLLQPSMDSSNSSSFATAGLRSLLLLLLISITDITMTTGEPIKGRGAQFNTDNKFQQAHYTLEHEEGVDELPPLPNRQLIREFPRTIISKSSSPDLRMMYSINPYQGCEHGCVYCYARNAHEYWGYSAGLDFESKIMVKPEAPQLLERHFQKRSWQPAAIALSGNTDCYQPVERELKITRQLLKVFLRYGNPVGIITKNVLIERDLNLLRELAADRLVHVYFSINSLDESLRRVMEPRTAAATKRLATMEKLSAAGVPCGVMVAPMIPGLNDHEISADHPAGGGGGCSFGGLHGSAPQRCYWPAVSRLD